MSKINPESLLATDKGLISTLHLRVKEGIKKGGYRITGYEALFFLRAKVATAKLSVDRDRIVYLRLRTDIQTARQRVIEMLDATPPSFRAVDSKTYRRTGNTYELHIPHCKAFLNVTHQKDYMRMLKNFESVPAGPPE